MQISEYAQQNDKLGCLWNSLSLVVKLKPQTVTNYPTQTLPETT